MLYERHTLTSTPARGSSLDVVPCSDLAGDIIALGQDVSSFKTGDRVSAGRLLGFVEGTLGDTTFRNTGTGIYIDGVLSEYKVLPAEVCTEFSFL